MDSIIRAFDWSIHDGVICKESYPGVKSTLQIIDEYQEQQKPKNRALRNSRYDRSYGGRFTLYNDLLGAADEEVLNPSLGLPSYTVVIQLEKEALVRDLVKGLGKIQQDGIGLPSIVYGCCEVVNGEDELGLAGSLFPESVLSICDDVVLVQVARDFRRNNVFEKLTTHTSQ